VIGDWRTSLAAYRRAALIVLVSLSLLGLSTLTAEAQKKGGTLRVGILGEPPSLDVHWTTATITETLGNHIYEGLYTLDAANRPIPMLAESHSVSKDSLTYTFKLRQGVKFHNGTEMTSEEVASLARWGAVGLRQGPTAQVAEREGPDKYTVEMKLKEKSAIVLISAVRTTWRHLPEGVAEKFAPEVKATEFVERPFKLAEWKPDQYIRMVRLTRRRARLPTASAAARPRTSTRSAAAGARGDVAQVETGEPRRRPEPDAYDRLKKNANLRPIVAKGNSWLIAVLTRRKA
jgi:ABC-type transport system substrate-binding protein